MNTQTESSVVQEVASSTETPVVNRFTHEAMLTALIERGYGLNENTNTPNAQEIVDIMAQRLPEVSTDRLEEIVKILSTQAEQYPLVADTKQKLDDIIKIIAERQKVA